MIGRQLTAQSKKKKLQDIQNALKSDPVDISALKRLAVKPGGFISDEFRRKAWPKLLGIDIFDAIIKPDNLESHKYYQQVLLDVNRSTRRFPANISNNERKILQRQLLEVILWVLTDHPELHYYQGYHDICVTFLMVCGQKLTYRLMKKLSLFHLRDFMQPTMEKTSQILSLVIPIVQKCDKALAEYLVKSHVGTIFALSWLITWYGHVLTDKKQVLRLYDFFLVCHPLMPIYLAAQILIYRSADIIRQECDMAIVHHFLTNLPPDLPLEQLISNSADLFIQFPPESLGKDTLRYYQGSLAISTFRNFELVSHHQRPDHVLRQLKERPKVQDLVENEEAKYSMRPAKRVAAIILSGAIGAAAVALANVSFDMFQWF